MGIAGAAWGTFTGIVVGAGIRMAMFLSININSEFKSRTSLNIDLGRMTNLLKVGIPAGFELTLNVALWGVILFSLVGRFGTEAVAATSAAIACTHFAILPIVGMGSALTAAVGKSIGRGASQTAVRQTRACLRTGLIFMGPVAIFFFIFRSGIMTFWSSDKDVIEIGSKILICASLSLVFYAARTIYSSSLRGAGDTLWLAVVSTIGALGVLGAGGLIISMFFPGLESLGPWFAATCSIIAVAVANRNRFKSYKWKKINLFKHPPGGVPIEIEAVE
jgi:Na+-driven multidrug efflux pump